MEATTARTRATATTVLDKPALYNIDCNILPKTGSYGQLYKITSQTTRNQRVFTLHWAIFKRTSSRSFANTKLAANSSLSASYIDKLCTAYVIPKNNKPLKQLIGDIAKAISSSKDTLLIRIKVSSKDVAPLLPASHVIVPANQSSRAMSQPRSIERRPVQSINRASTVKTTVISKNENVTKQAKCKNDKIWTTRSLRRAVRDDRKNAHRYHNSLPVNQKPTKSGMLGSFKIKK